MPMHCRKQRILRRWANGSVLKQHPDNPYLNLVQGMFLAQSGQSEQSVVFYKEAARLAPQSAYPHYFSGSDPERANHLEMAIKEYREAVQTGSVIRRGPHQPGRRHQSRAGSSISKWPFLNIAKEALIRSSIYERRVARVRISAAPGWSDRAGKFEPALQAYKEALPSASPANPNDAEGFKSFALAESTRPGKGVVIRKFMDLAVREYAFAPPRKPIRNSPPAHTAFGWLLMEQSRRPTAGLPSRHGTDLNGGRAVKVQYRSPSL